MKLKGICMGKDLDSFLKEHGEVKVRYYKNKITYISLPSDAEVFLIHIAKGQLLALDYSYHGQRITFSQ